MTLQLNIGVCPLLGLFTICRYRPRWWFWNSRTETEIYDTQLKFRHGSMCGVTTLTGIFSVTQQPAQKVLKPGPIFGVHF